MKEFYSHKALVSFYLWFDHHMLDTARAFENVTGRLYPSTDEREATNYSLYSSPYRQWVYDASVSGASIPSGVTINGQNRGRESGVIFDYDNGKILVPTSTYGSNASVSGVYARKEFNTYTVTTQDQQMIFDGNYQPYSRYGMVAETGVSPYGFSGPAAFIMSVGEENKPFAFGGMRTTETKVRVILATDDVYALDGVSSVFADLTESVIPLIPLESSPLNENGDYKQGVTGYNYNTLAANNSSRYMYLERVTVAKVTTPNQAQQNANLRYAIIDFYLSDPRFPKLEL